MPAHATQAHRWAFPAQVLVLAVGCAHVPLPPDPYPTSYAVPSPLGEAPLPAGPLDLGEAIAYAAAVSPQVLAADARCRRAAGDTAGAGTWPSPELRLGRGREWGDSVGSWRQTEVGQSTETSSEQGSQHQSDAETEVTEERQYGQLTETTVSERRGTSASRTTAIGTSRSTYASQSAGTGWDRDTEDGFEVELSLAPPNPWQVRAARRAAQAGQRTAEADRQEEVHDLACRVAEAALRMAYTGRMRAAAAAFSERVDELQCRLRAAVAAGTASRDDYADICLRAASAIGEVAGLDRRRAGARRDFQLLTGLPPERLSLDHVGVDSLRVPTNVPGKLALRRADVLSAQWTAERALSEWRESQARRMPWLNRVEASYGWWDGSQTGGGSFGDTATKTTKSTKLRSQSSTDTQTETSTTDGGKTQTGTTQGTQSEQGKSVVSESESSWSAGSETSTRSDDGEEWWVGVVVDIPVFEWLSSEQRTRKEGARAAADAVDRLTRRAVEEIAAAGTARESSREQLAALQGAVGGLDRELETLAASVRDQGVSGEVDAVRVEQAICDARIRLLEQELDHALAVLHACRVSGVFPVAVPRLELSAE